MKRVLKPLTMLAWVLGVGVFLLFAPDHWGDMLAEIKRILAGMGGWAGWVFSFATALLMLVGSPRLLFFALAGVLFGFWRGLFFAMLGSLLASWMMFRLTRLGGRRWARRKFGHHAFLASLANRMPDVWGVVMIRQLPLSNLLINTGLALSRVSTRTYMLGTLVGFLPQGTVACLLGSGTGHGLMDNEVKGWAQIVAGGVLAAGFGAWLYRRRMSSGANSID